MEREIQCPILKRYPITGQTGGKKQPVQPLLQSMLFLAGDAARAPLPFKTHFSSAVA